LTGGIDWVGELQRQLACGITASVATTMKRWQPLFPAALKVL
jgi:hypothetical protein